MRNFFKNKKIYKKLLLVVIIGYIIFPSSLKGCMNIFEYPFNEISHSITPSKYLIYVSSVNQQKALDAYNNEKEYNMKKLEEEQEYNESLVAMQENINSSEYIEQIARENLYMYLPNEKVYIDRSKQ